ncbi:MAG: Kae1-associated kinase Bud32 [Desulfurococcales archaeon]|nr:Kae1-associated kinase Bud32 [Desulfurococcales archaeon]
MEHSILEEILERSKQELVAIGAEAQIWKASWYGYPAIIKVRRRKKYLHPQLLDEINVKRMRRETKILVTLAKTGVCVPTLYAAFFSKWALVMKAIEGQPLSQCLKDRCSQENIKLAGRYLGLIHNVGVIHGDYTVNNMIVTNRGDTCIIDFGLSEFSTDPEDRAMDLYLFLKSINSILPPEIAEDYFGIFLKAYSSVFNEWYAVKERLEEIMLRGRYVEERRLSTRVSDR